MGARNNFVQAPSAFMQYPAEYLADITPNHDESDEEEDKD